MAGGGNVFLIVVSVVMFFLLLVGNVYVLVHYQHPDDKNDTWASKGLVILALTVAEVSVLMFPMDVSNRQTCDAVLDLSQCDLTMPMEGLWYAVWMIMALLAFVILPFALFYYEGDSEWGAFKRTQSALIWTVATLVVVAMIICIPYGVVGYTQYDFDALASGTVDIAAIVQPSPTATGCVPAKSYGASELGGGALCDASAEHPGGTWERQSPFPVYVVAITSVVGWIFLSMFAGVGAVALPFDWVMDFASRPTKVITKSEYISRARNLARRAKELREIGTSLKREEMSTGRSRKWRKEAGELNKQVSLLEQDEAWLARAYPQGEQREAAWIWTVTMYYLKLIGGIVGGLVSVFWLLHMILYLFVQPPASPFLNSFFSALQDAWGLLGTVAFAAFCLYIVAMAVHGLFRMGFFVGFFTIHPMKVGLTFMSTFLFNCVVVLVLSVAIVQFCAWAFAVYAEGTVVHDIFATQVQHLKGFGPLYSNSVFQYMFLGALCLSVLWFAIRGGKGNKKGGDIL